MLAHFVLEPRYWCPSRMAVELDRSSFAWSDDLSGRTTLIAGSDGLSLLKLRVAPVPTGKNVLKPQDCLEPRGAAWVEIRLQPRARKQLEFRLPIPPECAARSRGTLLIECVFRATFLETGDATSLAYETVTYSVDFKVHRPPVIVRVADQIARRTGLVVTAMNPMGAGHLATFTYVGLAAPAGTETIDALELTLHHSGSRVSGIAEIKLRKRGLHWVRQKLLPADQVQLHLDLDLTQLETSLTELACALRPYLGVGRDLPIPLHLPPGAPTPDLPLPAAGAVPGVETLPGASNEPDCD